MKKLKLEIEPILESNWGISLARLLPKHIWDVIRREVYQKYDYTCFACGETGVEVHCHERWHYDHKKRTQFLRGLICLCKDCHNIKHWGRTINCVHSGEYAPDYLVFLTNHFCEVNNCSLEDFEQHKVEVGNRLDSVRKKKYKVDFGIFEPKKIIPIIEGRLDTIKSRKRKK